MNTPCGRTLCPYCTPSRHRRTRGSFLPSGANATRNRLMLGLAKLAKDVTLAAESATGLWERLTIDGHVAFVMVNDGSVTLRMLGNRVASDLPQLRDFRARNALWIIGKSPEARESLKGLYQEIVEGARLEAERTASARERAEQDRLKREAREAAERARVAKRVTAQEAANATVVDRGLHAGRVHVTVDEAGERLNLRVDRLRPEELGAVLDALIASGVVTPYLSKRAGASR